MSDTRRTAANPPGIHPGMVNGLPARQRGRPTAVGRPANASRHPAGQALWRTMAPADLALGYGGRATIRMFHEPQDTGAPRPV